MKVLANGGLNISTLDGWWDEAYSPEVGWLIGDGRESESESEPGAGSSAERDDEDARNLYRLLEEEVIPLFYQRNDQGIPSSWVAKIKASMAQLTPRYSSMRMMKEYVEKIYHPAQEAYRRRAADGAKLAQQLVSWQERISQSWSGIHFGRLKVSREEARWHFQVEVYLGDVSPEDVQVELYADALPRSGREEEHSSARILMEQGELLAGSVNGFIYSADVPGERKAEDYTPRIVPYHPDAFIPQEDAHILWMR
jgi:starch phosphorylase